jgi:hypothetical protein
VERGNEKEGGREVTQRQADLLPYMTIEDALGMAYRAGAANLAGSHYCFAQTHLNEKDVVVALLAAIKKGEKK